MQAWARRIVAGCVVALGATAAQAQQQGSGGYTVVGATPNGSAIGVVPQAGADPQARTVATRRFDGREARRPEEYGGVTPGLQSVPPGLRRMARLGTTRVPVAAWPGFQMQPGGSRVFVAMTQNAVVTESRSALQRVIHIAGGRIALSNNRRPLITEAFATPLNRAWLRQVRGGIDLVLDMRAEVDHRTSQELGPQGLHFLYVDFPPFAAPDTIRLHLPNGRMQEVEVGAPITTNAVVPREPGPRLDGPGVVVQQPVGSDNERPPAMR